MSAKISCQEQSPLFTAQNFNEKTLSMKPSSDLPTVSIITPNWNGGDEPLEFISSIKQLNYPQKKLEIIVVDNGSQDGSPEAISQKYPQVHLIRLGKNVGFGPALNKGIKQSKGDFIFIGNDDLVLAKNSLFRLVSYALNHAQAGIVGGKIFFKNDRQKISSSGHRYNFFSGIVSDCPYPDQEKEVPWVQGCACLFPRYLIEKIGYYDEGFSKIYFEDFDLCLRAKRAGFKIVYLPQAVFYHGQSTSMDKIPSPAKWFQWYKNKFRFILKHANLFQILTSFGLQLLVFTPYKTLVLRDKSFIAVVKALIWNVRHIQNTLK